MLPVVVPLIVVLPVVVRLVVPVRAVFVPGAVLVPGAVVVHVPGKFVAGAAAGRAHLTPPGPRGS
jgi:hypothetical protein